MSMFPVEENQFGLLNPNAPMFPDYQRFEFPQQQQPNFMDALAGGLFGDYGGLLGPQDRQTAINRGLLGAGAALLQASGPSTRPISIGQAVGGAIPAGLNASDAYGNRQAMNNLAQQKLAQMGARSRSPYFSFLPTANGYAVGNNRSGEITPPGVSPVVPAQFDPRLQGSIASAKAAGGVYGKHGAELNTTQPQVESTIQAQGVKTEMLDDLINQAKGQAGLWTTGFLGQKLSNIGGTPAHDLNNTLNTIKSNIGFDKLQEMRANSKTGGALGQVSERENELLQSVWGALAQSQTEDQFKQNLDRVNKQVKESWGRVLTAYKKDYGRPYNGSMPWSQKLSSPSIDDLLKKY